MSLTGRIKKSLRRLILFLIPAILLTASGCAERQAEPLSETRLMLDTVCTITLYGGDSVLLSEAIDLCAKYEAMFSRTQEGSDVWRINHARGEPVEVSHQTAELIRTGLEFGAFSGGLFDISVGRLSALWDFGGSPSVPVTDELTAALETVDYTLVEVTGNTVTLSNADAWLDLGGIAKGYIADELSAFLKERGVSGAVIDLGGNIVTVGAKPGGGSWRVGVERPFSNRSELAGILSVGEASVVTSGIYERQFTQDDILYHHILSPIDGMPSDSDIVSATVVTKTSVFADALSTVLVLTGSGQAAELLDELLEGNSGVTGAALTLKSGEILLFGNIEFERAA